MGFTERLEFDKYIIEKEYITDKIIIINYFDTITGELAGYIELELFLDFHSISRELPRLDNDELLTYFPKFTAIFINSVFVDKEYRGFGIGNILMQNFIEMYHNKFDSPEYPVFLMAIPEDVGEMSPEILYKFYNKYGFQKFAWLDSNAQPMILYFD